ncbi:VIT1/CCC1 transporter family protein [Aestuariimicrobium kwangyangense]|uniref:VIT1/CCC1 transporter family protein n=1 Tax=Aestuariimicrobium kwangyangense TaxID=396389 RepID=UPI0003B43102|nr:VIT family protein [Aestuariimicrobium kwangyangense]
MTQTSSLGTLASEGDSGTQGFHTRLNWLRAAVLGANDGIVSIAGLVVGVAAATTSSHALLVAGVAGVIAGALSMAAGEYVSVSTQRDGERSLVDRKRSELQADPDGQLERLAALYRAKGLDAHLAEQVAEQLTSRNALAAHAEADLGVDPEELTNPWHAAWASMLSFTLGALLPLAAVLLTPVSWKIPVTVLAVTVALAITGASSAKLGEAPAVPATLRNVLGGATAMAVTYGVGLLFGTLGG